MAKVFGMKKTQQKLKFVSKKYSPDRTLRFEVGYEAPYAIYVHENLESYHPNGEAKYLERPAREMRLELAEIVRKELKSGKTLREALYTAGYALQRASQRLVPVDTGFLHDSAFTKLIYRR